MEKVAIQTLRYAGMDLKIQRGSIEGNPHTDWTITAHTLRTPRDLPKEGWIQFTSVLGNHTRWGMHSSSVLSEDFRDPGPWKLIFNSSVPPDDAVPPEDEDTA